MKTRKSILKTVGVCSLILFLSPLCTVANPSSDKINSIKYAAEKGDVKYQREFGLALKRGEIIEQDFNQSVLWLNKAAKKNDIKAAIALFPMYQRGIGTQPNSKEAFRLLRLIASYSLGTTPDAYIKNSVVNAQYHLAWWYALGRGIGQEDQTSAAYWFKKAASNGHAKAQYEIFRRYQLGINKLDSSNTNVKHYLQKAAMAGLPEAQNALAHEISKHGAWDHAFQLYKKAADKKNAQAQFQVGLQYYQGLGVPKNLYNALKYFEYAAEQGHAKAQNNVATLFLHDPSLQDKPKQALSLYQASAEKGNTKAQYSLGLIYLEGELTDQNLKLASVWLHRAAQKEFAPAQYHLGLMYQNGQYVKQDDSKALELMHAASEQLYTPAQYRMAMRYENGQGVKTNLKQAFTLYKKVADSGELQAQYKIASMYEKGIGVDESKEQAMIWYEKAAFQHHILSQKKLANAYYTGQVLRKDYGKAFYWYDKAASLGDPEAQFHVANLYFDGKGTKQSTPFAIDWYGKAEKQGYNLAKKALDKIYDGVDRVDVTPENATVLVCPEGGTKDPNTGICHREEIVKEHFTTDYYGCDEANGKLTYDDARQTCYRQETTTPINTCPSGMRLDSYKQVCYRGRDYKFALETCDAGYIGDPNTGRCFSEWDYATNNRKNYWLSRKYTGKNAMFFGSQVYWNGKNVTGDSFYYCDPHHKECDSFSRGEYVYKKAKSSAFHKHSWKDSQKYKWFLWFKWGYKTTRKGHESKYAVKRNLLNSQYQRSCRKYEDALYSAIFTLQNGQCISHRAETSVIKKCPQGKLSHNELYCEYEHQEDPVLFVEDHELQYTKHHKEGQIVKRIPGNRIAQKVMTPHPDIKGLSIIKISNLNLDGEIFEINNDPDQNPHLDASATEIVVQLDEPTVNARIKVIGNQANLILIHPDKIECQVCDFINTPRVTVATGDIHKDPKGGLHQLRINRGQIVVNNILYAKTASFLEILTPKLELAPYAKVSTNFNGYRLNGEIRQHPQGQLEFGTGKMQILLGLFDYDYDESTADVVQNPLEYKSLWTKYGSRIDSGEIKIQSLGEKAGVIIDGLISTKSDASVMQHYAKKLVFSNSNITLDVLGSLNIDGFIEANSDIKISSSGNLDIAIWDYKFSKNHGYHNQEQSYREKINSAFPHHTNLLAKNIHLISLNNIQNQGSASSNNFFVDASNIYNEGIWKASEKMILKATDDQSRIENRYGGILSASIMALKSGFLLRNGSPFNFRSQLLRKPLPLRRNKRSIEPVYDEGTIHKVEKAAYFQEINKATANIFANKLAMEAPYVENVNPYELRVISRGSESRNYYNSDFDNTSIYVKGDLSINASERFINGSASIQTGLRARIESKKVYNERYHVRIETECGFRSSKEDEKYNLERGKFSHTDCPDEVAKYIESYPEKYAKNGSILVDSEDVKTIDSPAGRIFIGNNLYLKSELLHNTMGFIEVHNDMLIESDDVKVETYTLNHNLNFHNVTPTWFQCSDSYSTLTGDDGQKYCYRSYHAIHRDNPLFSALVVGGSLYASGEKDFSVKILNKTDAYGNPHKFKKLMLKEEARKFLDESVF